MLSRYLFGAVLILKIAGLSSAHSKGKVVPSHTLSANARDISDDGITSHQRTNSNDEFLQMPQAPLPWQLKLFHHLFKKSVDTDELQVKQTQETASNGIEHISTLKPETYSSHNPLSVVFVVISPLTKFVRASLPRLHSFAEIAYRNKVTLTKLGGGLILSRFLWKRASLRWSSEKEKSEDDVPIDSEDYDFELYGPNSFRSSFNSASLQILARIGSELNRNSTQSSTEDTNLIDGVGVKRYSQFESMYSTLECALTKSGQQARNSRLSLTAALSEYNRAISSKSQLLCSQIRAALNESIYPSNPGNTSAHSMLAAEAIDMTSSEISLARRFMHGAMLLQAKEAENTLRGLRYQLLRAIDQCDKIMTSLQERCIRESTSTSRTSSYFLRGIQWSFRRVFGGQIVGKVRADMAKRVNRAVSLLRRRGGSGSIDQSCGDGDDSSPRRRQRNSDDAMRGLIASVGSNEKLLFLSELRDGLYEELGMGHALLSRLDEIRKEITVVAMHWTAESGAEPEAEAENIIYFEISNTSQLKNSSLTGDQREEEIWKSLENWLGTCSERISASFSRLTPASAPFLGRKQVGKTGSCISESISLKDSIEIVDVAGGLKDTAHSTQSLSGRKWSFFPSLKESSSLKETEADASRSRTKLAIEKDHAAFSFRSHFEPNKAVKDTPEKFSHIPIVQGSTLLSARTKELAVFSEWLRRLSGQKSSDLSEMESFRFSDQLRELGLTEQDSPIQAGIRRIFSVINVERLIGAFIALPVAYVGYQTILFPEKALAITKIVWENVGGFVDRRIASPMSSIAKDVFLNKKTPLLDAGALSDAKRSLSVMIHDFLSERDNKGLTRFNKKTENEMRNSSADRSEMEPISIEYEKELRRPISSILSGRIARLVLIQLQFVKKELLMAMQAIDDLFNANQVNLQLMAIIPAVFSLRILQITSWFFVGLVSYGSRGKMAQSLLVAERELNEGFRELERGLIFERVEASASKESSSSTQILHREVVIERAAAISQGRLLSRLYRLHLILSEHYHHYESHRRKALQSDLRDLASHNLSTDQKLLLLQRIYRKSLL